MMALFIKRSLAGTTVLLVCTGRCNLQFVEFLLRSKLVVSLLFVDGLVYQAVTCRYNFSTSLLRDAIQKVCNIIHAMYNIILDFTHANK